MQAAHLTRQQMIRAVPFDVALLNSFADVYIKPRNACDFASSHTESMAKIKNNMMKTIENELKDIEVLEVRTASSTLRVKELCTHSALEIANQLAYSVIQVDEGFSSLETTLMQTLYSIFIAYQRCPKEIMFALRTVIDTNFDERNDFTVKRKVYSLAMNKKAYEHHEGNELIVANQRFYSEQYTLQPDVIKTTNESAILLYLRLVGGYYLNVMHSEEGVKFVDYSRGYQQGHVTDDFPEYPLLRNCLNYVQFIEECIEGVIRSIRSSLDDKTTLRILQVLNWKNRFYDIAFSNMFVKNEDSRLRILDMSLVKSLYLHSKWIHKHLIEELFKLLPEGNSIEEKYYANYIRITGGNELVSSNLAKVCKKVRQQYGQPKLYANKDQFQKCLSRRNIFEYTTVDLMKPLDSQLEMIPAYCNIVTDENLATDVPDEEIIENAAEYMERHNENSTGEIDDMAIVKMPMYSCLIHKVLHSLKMELAEVLYEISNDSLELKTRIDLSEAIANVVHHGRKHRVLGTEFLSLLACIQKLLNGTMEIPKSR